MKQTGTFYTLTNNANGTETKSPLPNIYIYFSQKGVRKLTTQTSKAGKFNFDLPLGDYNVTYSQGASHNVYNLAGGSTFSLTASSAVNEFEKWAMTPVYLKPEENPLVIRLSELAKIATDAATEAKEIQDAMNKGSSGTGKWVKESLISKMIEIGDFGVGSKSDEPELKDFHELPEINQTITTTSDWLNRPPQSGVGITRTFARKWSSGTQFWVDVLTRSGHFFKEKSSNVWDDDWYNYLTSKNTTIDSNGNIKAASPIIKLFNDRIEHSGFGDNEPIFEKLGVGQYKISNTLGLAQEGWTYEKPRGSDGQPYFRIIVEKLEDGCIVRVHDEYDTVEKAEITDIDGNTRTVDKIVKILGQARDIKEHERWIDLRFHEEIEDYKEN